MQGGTIECWRAVFGVAALITLTGCVDVSEYAPHIVQAGRFVTVARAPGRPDEFLAASETGGLFRSVDGGFTWSLVVGLPSSRIADVAYAPQDANVIVVTFREDFRIGTGSGPIWLSNDGGHIWNEAPIQIPTGGICPAQTGGRGISFEPRSATIYVGTSCGMAISSDLGIHWALDFMEPAYTSPFVNGIGSVTATGDGRVYAAGDGVVSIREGELDWKRLSGVQANIDPYCVHCIAVSPIDNHHIFVFGATLQQSTDAGETWTQITSIPPWGNREPFVVASGPLQWAGFYDLYASDGTNLQRLRILDVPPVTQVISTKQLKVEHVDLSDLIFDLDGVTPKLLSGDGGLQVTIDGGNSWTLDNGGEAGLHALQIYEVAGQFVGRDDQVARHLYFGTQDNALWASPDAGLHWTNNAGPEGYVFQNDRAVTVSDQSRIFFLYGPDDTEHLSRPLFSQVAPWSAAPPFATTPYPDDKPIRLSGSRYVQNTHPSGPPFTNAYRLTDDWGASWSPAPVMLSDKTVVGPPVVVQQNAGQLLAQPVRLSIDWSTGFGVYGLWQWAFPSLAQIDPNGGLKNLAVEDRLPSRGVFAVNPQNANQMIAVDIGDEQVKYSIDSGASWHADQSLTTMISDSGKYRFLSADGHSLISVVGWDPDAPCHILVGARQGGIYETSDGGDSWRHVSGSEAIPEVSSFYFPPQGHIIVSSFGRGLWELHVDRRQATCNPHRGVRLQAVIRLLDPSSGAPLSSSPDGPFPERCNECSIIVARYGEVGAVDIRDGRLLRFVLRRGMVYQFDRSGSEIALQIPNVEFSELKDSWPTAVAQQLADDQVKGLVVREDRLVALVVSQRELQLKPRRVPKTTVTGARTAYGVVVAGNGDQLTLVGEGFDAGSRAITEMTGNCGPQRFQVIPDRTGRFRFNVVACGTAGSRHLVTTQQDGKRLIKTITMFDVTDRDAQAQRK